MNHSLKGKRVLFFYLSTFNYEYEIKSAMEREGAIVDSFNERPSNSISTKVVLKFNRNLISRRIEKYYDSIIQETQNNRYDYIFFIKGESVSKEIISKIRTVHPESKIVIYLWDSSICNKNAYTMLDSYDQVYSFDPADCKLYGVNFLPLFYIPKYSRIADSTSPREYDVMFAGTVHNDRYDFVNNIKRQIEKHGGKCFTYFYFPSRLSFYKLKWDNPHFRTASIKNFHFNPLSSNSLIKLYEKTLAQIDYNDPYQTGLTMRTIETLGAKKKLITTNQDIVNYDFYRPENILVVDRKAPTVNYDFIQTPMVEIPEEISYKYSISSWLNTIFEI